MSGQYCALCGKLEAICECAMFVDMDAPVTWEAACAWARAYGVEPRTWGRGEFQTLDVSHPARKAVRFQFTTADVENFLTVHLGIIGGFSFGVPAVRTMRDVVTLWRLLGGES